MYFEYNNFPTNAIVIMISAINLNGSAHTSNIINLKYGSVARDSNRIEQQIFPVKSKWSTNQIITNTLVVVLGIFI
jgi:hypothetical protein